MIEIALAAAVPLRILDLKSKGGPSKEDIERAQQFGVVLAEKGDVLLFGSRKKGEVADLFNRLAESIAVLAFLPGGVKVFGQQWEASS